MAYGKKYIDGFIPQVENPSPLVRRYPVAAAVAIAKGDCLVITQGTGYAELATTLATNGAVFAIAMEPNTAGEANANGDVEVLAIPILAPVMYKVPVTANTVLVQATHVGYTYNLDGSEDGISLAANPTTYYGFRIPRNRHIDRSNSSSDLRVCYRCF